MKYLEELSFGDCFEHGESHYVLSSDFKSNGKKMCLCLKTGFSHWFNGDLMVNVTDLFTMDQNNNIIAIKERSKNDLTKDTDIS